MDTFYDPIAALATPVGRGALAVIRLSGGGAHEIFAGVIAERDRFLREDVRKIGIYTVLGESTVSRETPVDSTGSRLITDQPAAVTDGVIIIDEVTAVKYAAPRSFTGEDTVEIFCHGGTVIPQKILDRLYRAGARAAGRGEFSRRAWANGKIDILKAESIAGLIDCQTEKHLKSARLAYSGRQLESLKQLKRRIAGVLSDVESGIEFAEEDDVAKPQEDLVSANKRELESVIKELEEDLRRGDRIRTFDNGVIVAIAGPPNAGKSSLFNVILGYDRSIVHDRPGTTRDAVSEKILFDGVTVKLFDCAGIRDTGDAVEQRGIERTLSAVEDAHAVFWVTSAGTPFDSKERNEILNSRSKTLVVINKIDLARPDVPHETSVPSQKKQFCESNNLPYVTISLTQKINTAALFDTLKSFVHSTSSDAPAPEIVINERHRNIAAAMVTELRQCLDNFGREEISAHYLKKALDLTAEFLGHTAGDEVLNGIFSKFCIGK